MTQLFLSYSREDRPVVEALAADLRASGYTPYFDEELVGGQDWWAELLTRIEDARAFVPVLTPGFLDSTPCQLEAAYAAALGKPFLPVSVEPVPPQLCPEAISSSQWVDYDHQEAHSILAVIRAINGLGPTPPLPDPRPERPVVPISYMNELQNEIGSHAEIARSRQVLIIADLKGRLGTPDRQAAILLLRRIRDRADIGYQAAVDIDETLAKLATTPGVAPPVEAPVAAAVEEPVATEEPVTTDDSVATEVVEDPVVAAPPVEEPSTAPVEEPVDEPVRTPIEEPVATDGDAAVPRAAAVSSESAPDLVEPPAPRWVTVVGRSASVALLAVFPIMVLAFTSEASDDGGNLFAVLSPIEAVLAAIAVWVLVGALGGRRLSTAAGAGALTTIGALTLAGSVGLVKFSSTRLGAGAAILSVLALLGATAILAAGVSCIRASRGTARRERIDSAALVLALVGAGLSVVALFQHYDGLSSLAIEFSEGYSAEFFFEPAVAVVLVLVGLACLSSWPRFGVGVLITVGVQIAVHYLGVLVAAHFAVGEVGETGPAGFIGLFAGVLVAAAGYHSHVDGPERPLSGYSDG